MQHHPDITLLVHLQALSQAVIGYTKNNSPLKL